MRRAPHFNGASPTCLSLQFFHTPHEFWKIHRHVHAWFWATQFVDHLKISTFTLSIFKEKNIKSCNIKPKSKLDLNNLPFQRECLFSALVAAFCFCSQTYPWPWCPCSAVAPIRKILGWRWKPEPLQSPTMGLIRDYYKFVWMFFLLFACVPHLLLAAVLID